MPAIVTERQLNFLLIILYFVVSSWQLWLLLKWKTAILFHLMYWICQSPGVVVSHVTVACKQHRDPRVWVPHNCEKTIACSSYMRYFLNRQGLICSFNSRLVVYFTFCISILIVSISFFPLPFSLAGSNLSFCVGWIGITKNIRHSTMLLVLTL